MRLPKLVSICWLLVAGLFVVGCDDPRDESCRRSLLCERYGACEQVDEETGYALDDFYCGPGASAHCAKSTWSCTQDGLCSYRDGACVAASDADCARSTLACSVEGRCSGRQEACVVASDADCAKSLVCEAYEACTEVRGECGFSRAQKIEMYDKAPGHGKRPFYERKSADESDLFGAAPAEDERFGLTGEQLVHACLQYPDYMREVRACLREPWKPEKGFHEAFTDAQLEILCRLRCDATGQCDVGDGRCVARHDRDCRRSEMCRSWGRCGLVDGECAATNDAHCQSSKACKEKGRCVAEDGLCVVASEEK